MGCGSSSAAGSTATDRPAANTTRDPATAPNAGADASATPPKPHRSDADNTGDTKETDGTHTAATAASAVDQPNTSPASDASVTAAHVSAKSNAAVSTTAGAETADVNSSPAAGQSKLASNAVSGLRGVALLADAAPLPGASALSAVLRRCADLLHSASTRFVWLTDFEAYLFAVSTELAAAQGVFSRQSHLVALTEELQRAEQSLKVITARSSISAALHSAADENTMQQHRSQCERIKQQSIMQMLSEGKADSAAINLQAKQLQSAMAEGTALPLPARTSEPAASATTPAAIAAPPAASSSDSASVTLSSLSSALGFIPLASAASLAASLDRCSGIIASIRSRGQWLSAFDQYLSSVRSDLTSASAAFSRSSAYLTALSAQLVQSEKLLRNIAERSAWKAPLCASGDRQSLQAQQAACEKIKSEALSAMLTEMQADTSTTLTAVASIREMLAASEHQAQQLQRKQEQLAADERLVARLQPIDFTADVDRELERFMPGTRVNIISAVDRWLSIGGTSAAAAAVGATITPAAVSKGLTDASSSPAEPAPAASALAAASPSASSAPASSSRLFWIRGGPGAGKSCLSAKLLSAYSAEIVAVHFCRHDSVDRRDPRRLVRSIAHQMAQRLPLYAEKLRAAIPAVFGSDAQTTAKSASDLWQQLLVTPLHAISSDVAAERKASGRKYALLIDALDEASSSGSLGSSELLTLLASSAAELPQWLGIIVTSRPESLIVQRLSRYTPLEMDCDSDDNRADLRAFFTHCLRQAHAPAAQRVSADGPPTLPNEVALIDLLMTKSAGLFLLGRMMMEQHELLRVSSDALDAPSLELRDFPSHPLCLDEVAQWPAGLDAFYFTCMRRVRAAVSVSAGQSAGPVDPSVRSVPIALASLLSVVSFVLCAAEPLNLGCIAEMLELKDAAAVFRLLAPIRALMPVASPEGQGQAAAAAAAVSPLCTVSVFHKSVRDWFLSPVRIEEAAIDEEAIYAIDEQHTQAAMAARCWKRIVDDTAQPLSAGSSDLSSAPSSPSLSLPALCVDELSEVRMEATGITQSESAAAPLPLQLSSAHLGYALSFGPWHALQCDDEAASATFLCHPQYLHMRCLIGQGSQLNDELSRAVQQAEAVGAKVAAGKAKASKSKAGNSVAGSAAEEWRWSLRLPSPLTALSLIRRLYLAHAVEWVSQPQLVYQYCVQAPDDTIAAQLAQCCMGWFRQWDGRSVTIATWQTKPQQLTTRPHRIDCGVGLRSFSLHPDGVHLAAGYDSSVAISVFDVDSGVALFSLPLPPHPDNFISAIAFSPDGRFLACACSHRELIPIYVFSFSDRSLLYTLVGHGIPSWSSDPRLSWSSDSAILAAQTWERGPLLLHSMADGSLLQSCGMPGIVNLCGTRFLLPDEQILIVGSEVSVWSLARRKPLVRLGHVDGLDFVAVPPDSSCVALPTKDGSLIVSTANGSTLSTIIIPPTLIKGGHSPESIVLSTQWVVVLVTPRLLFFSVATGLLHHCVMMEMKYLAFSADGTRLLGLTKSRVVASLLLSSVPALPMSDEAVAHAAGGTSPDGLLECAVIYLTSLHRIVRDVRESSTLPPLPLLAHTQDCPLIDRDRFDSIALSADNSEVMRWSSSSGLYIEDLATLQLKRELDVPSLRRSAGEIAYLHVLSMVWSPDGKALATQVVKGDRDSLVRGKATGPELKLFSLESARAQLPHTKSDPTLTCMTFSRDSTRLAVATKKSSYVDGTTVYGWVILSVPELNVLTRFVRVGSLPIVLFEWSAADDALLVVTAVGYRSRSRSSSEAVSLFNPTSGQLIRTLLTCEHGTSETKCGPHCSYRVWGARFTADCSRIAAWYEDRWVRIVRCSDGALQHSIRLHLPVSRVEWHPDGRSLYTLQNDCAVRHHTLPRSLWPVDVSAAASSVSVVSSSANSAAPPRGVSYSSFVDDAPFHRIVYED